MRQEVCTHGDTLEVDPGGSSNSVRLVYPSQRNAVDSERSGNQQQTTLQLLQEHYPLPPEPSSQQNQDGSRGDPRTELCGADSLPALFRLSYVLSWVVSRSF